MQDRDCFGVVPRISLVVLPTWHWEGKEGPILILVCVVMCLLALQGQAAGEDEEEVQEVLKK